MDINRRKAVFLCLFIAFLSTALLYQDFGSEDQESELPLIYRAIDHDYLGNDPYVNDASNFGPRYFYVKLVSLISTEDSLPWTAFVLVLFINAVAALTSYSLTQELLGGTRAAGVLSAALVMSLPLFRLGTLDFVVTRQLLGSGLAFAFITLAFLAAFRAFPLRWALFSGIASVVHPTFGAEAGALAFVILLRTLYLRQEEGSRSLRTFIAGQGLRLAFSAALFLSCVALPLLPYLRMPRIEGGLFVAIETRFRHPHHSYPGHLSGWGPAAAVLASFGLAWYFLRKRSQEKRRHLPSLILLAVIIGILCLAGIFFLEIVPMRIWAAARPFRLLFLLKWLGLILMGGLVSEAMGAGKGPSLTSEGLYLIPSLLSPLTMLLGTTALILRIKTSEGFVDRNAPPGYLRPAALSAVVVGLLVIFAPPKIPVLLAFGLGAGLWLLALLRPSPPLFTGAVLLLFLLWLLPFARYMPSAGRVPGVLLHLDPFSPGITYGDIEGELPRLARFARESTGEGALFLAPPDFGLFRLMARRALVVDWKAFPFQDGAMVRWKERLDACYGRTGRLGHSARDALKRDYRSIGDDKILALRNRYGISYAVLYGDTPTRLPVIYDDSIHKIISLKKLRKGAGSEKMEAVCPSTGF